MNSKQISEVVESELAAFSYAKPEPGMTYSEPWPEKKVHSYIPALRRSLVTPYRRKFRSDEAPSHNEREVFEEYWVVAIDGGISNGTTQSGKNLA